MPTSAKRTEQRLGAHASSESDALIVESAEGLAAALSEVARTGAPISADAELLARFGIADHGEDLGDLDLIFPDRSS